jgi:hypothetical protein
MPCHFFRCHQSRPHLPLLLGGYQQSKKLVSKRIVSGRRYTGDISIDLILDSKANFREVLHKAIQGGLEDDVDEIHRNGAQQLVMGWMHIHGERQRD